MQSPFLDILSLNILTIIYLRGNIKKIEGKRVRLGAEWTLSSEYGFAFKEKKIFSNRENCELYGHYYIASHFSLFIVSLRFIEEWN